MHLVDSIPYYSNFKCVNNNINWFATIIYKLYTNTYAMGANSSRTDVSLLSDDDGKFNNSDK